MTDTPKKKVVLKTKATPKTPITNSVAAQRLYGKPEKKETTDAKTK